MRYAILLFAAQAFGSTVSGSMTVDLDWIGDGGATLTLLGSGLFVRAEMSPVLSNSLLTCTDCSFGMDSHFNYAAAGQAAVGSFGGPTFALDLSDSAGHLSGTLTVFQPNTQTVLATSAIDTYYAASPVPVPVGHGWSIERTFEFSGQPLGGTTGGSAVVSNPEPGTWALLASGLLMGLVSRWRTSWCFWRSTTRGNCEHA